MRLVALTLALGCIATIYGYASPLPQSPRQPTGVEIEMRHVRLHLDDQIALNIEMLRGVMVSTTPGRPVNFDDPRSYVVRARAASLSIDMAALSAVLNKYVFSDGGPLTDVQIRALADHRLEQRAKWQKGVTVPVSIISSPSATQDGRLRLHIESITTAGLPVKGLLSIFGLSAQRMMSLNKPGVQMSGNDIVITPAEILPPPRLLGAISHVEIKDDQLVQTIGDPASIREAIAPQDSGAKNYIYFKGSSLRFGKLTMADTDLQLIDQNPATPFDFYPAKYIRQLVAGYSKNTPAGGLRTYMPDFDALDRRPETSTHSGRWP